MLIRNGVSFQTKMARFLKVFCGLLNFKANYCMFIKF